MKKNWTIRLLAGVAAGAMAFSMVGCGSNKDNSKNGSLQAERLGTGQAAHRLERQGYGTEFRYDQLHLERLHHERP